MAASGAWGSSIPSLEELTSSVSKTGVTSPRPAGTMQVTLYCMGRDCHFQTLFPCASTQTACCHPLHRTIPLLEQRAGVQRVPTR